MFSYKYSADNGGVYIGSDELVKWIKKAVESLKDDEDGHFYTASGDSIVIAFKGEEETRVVVARNYIEFIVNNDEIKDGWDNYAQGVMDSLEVG